MKSLMMSVLFCISSQTYALSLTEYFDQVSGENKDFVGNEKQAEAAKLKWYEGKLVFSPQIFAEAKAVSDEKKGNPPLLVYDSIDSQSFMMGLSEQFDFGLQSKFYYKLDHTRYVNSPTLSGPRGEFYDAQPVVELTMPFGKNFWGRASQAQQAVTLESNRAEEYASRGFLKQKMNEAENAYWALVVNREVIRIQKNALEQAEAILNYVTKKAKMKLGEEGDVLQAEALVSSRRLELKKAEADGKVARLNFNALKGVNSNVVSEELESIPYEQLLSLKLSEKKAGERYDLKAARSQLEVAAANAKLIEERNKPSLDLYATYALDGREQGVESANSNFLSSGRTTKIIGLKFSAPMDFDLTSKVKSGARMTEEAQRTIFRQKEIDQDRDWINLVERFQDSKESLILVEKLVEAQTKKLANEQSRLRIGRTTTYQVLLFEQDKSQAELSKVQISQALLNIRSAFKLYETK